MNTKLSFLALVCLLFTNSLWALTVTPSPSTLSCGTTTSVTFTFDCAFDGVRIVAGLPSGVSFPNEGTAPYLITVTGGVATIDVNVNQNASSTFAINFGPVSQNLSCAAGQTVSANFSFACTIAENDDCVDAIPLDISYGSCSYIDFITDNSSYSGTNPSCGPPSYNDLWYTFIANNSTVTMEWNKLPGSIGYYSLRTDCPNNGGTELACSILINGQSSTVNFNGLTIGSEYTLQMSFLPGESGNDQELCLHSATAPAQLNAICPSNLSIGSCLSQSNVNSQFANWLNNFEYENGCTVTESGNTGSAPSRCGGSKTINYTVTDDCGDSSSCSATFTVASAPNLSISCPNNLNIGTCKSQSYVNSQFASWLNNFNYSGGCTVTESGNTGTAPSRCGGSVTINYTVTDNCGQSESCSKTFTVAGAPTLNISCPTNMTLTTCNTQSFVNNQFSNWLNNFSYSGGCTVTESGNTGSAPSRCGGSKTINYVVTDNCGQSVNCTRTFTVSNAPNLIESCPNNQTISSCHTQSYVNTQFTNWLNDFDYVGGCTVTESGNTGTAPSRCGGSKTINYTVTDDCGQNESCSRTFTVASAPNLTTSCPNNTTINSCSSQTYVNNQFSNWLANFTYNGGCTVTETGNTGSAPSRCGGSRTINYSVTDNCGQSSSCSATFTVASAPNLTTSCPNNLTLSSGNTQSYVNSQFSSWLANFTYSGGCTVTETGNTGSAPSNGGGAVTINYSVTDNCGQSSSCSATFTVSNPANLIANCPNNLTLSSCNTQSFVNSQFASWLNNFNYSGGCTVTESGNTGTAPSRCGGSKTINYTVTDNCGQSSNCSATFTVSNPITLTASCPSNLTISSCESQSYVNTQFSNWLANFTYSGGCTVTESGNTGSVPAVCGGSTTINYSVTDNCGQSSNCSATFTVANAPVLTATCPSNTTVNSCSSQSTINTQFSNWLANFTYSGGCNVTEAGNTGSAPPACGGSVTINYSVSDDCAQNDDCSATFTVSSAPNLTISCPSNEMMSSCETQASIDNQFNNWINSFSYSGGCTVTETGLTGSAPLTCGGSVTINYNASDNCGQSESCTRTFTVSTPTNLVASCPSNTTINSCLTQANVNAQFNTWLSNFSYTGGCIVSESGNSGSAPAACGGSTTINYSVSDNCSQTSTCSATFTVSSPLDLQAISPGDLSISCDNQSVIDAEFATWLNGFSYTGGCTVTESGNTGTAPTCGNSVSITYTVTDNCGQSSTNSATFSVVNATPLNITCADNLYLGICNSQSFINAQFATWLSEFSYTGGCNVTESGNTGTAPSACGGTVVINYNVSDDCGQSMTCSAMFSVTSPQVLEASCPANVTISTCENQSSIDSQFATWLNDFTYTGGCNVVEVGNAGSAPSSCGGSVTINYSISDDCGQTDNCSAIFTVAAAPSLLATCPSNESVGSCESQAYVDAQFATWLSNFTYTGGCNVSEVGNNVSAPSACGGVVTVNYSVSDDCGQSSMCSADFSVWYSPTLSTNCPSDLTISCNDQSSINAQFNTWLSSFSYNGGCTVSESGLTGNSAPSCGGNTVVNYTVTDNCGQSSSCSAQFTVTASPSLLASCPSDMNVSSCETQASIDTMFFLWLADFNYSGGCVVTESGNTGTAPSSCGGSTVINYSVSDDCGNSSMCSAIFTVDSPNTLMANCPNDLIITTCETQVSIDSQFSTWLSGFNYVGGCNVTESGNNGSAPSACGGSVTINYNVSDDCGQSSMCSATFTVESSNTLTATCPDDVTISSCGNQGTVNSQFAIWLSGFSYSGGCNVTESGNGGSVPSYCGGSLTIIYTVSDDCGQSTSCSSTFTVSSPSTLVTVCPDNMTLPNCGSQSTIDSEFATWLSGFSYSGGCDVTESGVSGLTAPTCGNSITVNYAVNDDCGMSSMCSATFSVATAPNLMANCPSDLTINSCFSQASVNTQFASWLNNFDFTGGCNVTESGNTGSAPTACGGSITINYIVSDDCGQSSMCSATFTVSSSPTLMSICPSNMTLANCDSQSSIDSEFATWLLGFNFSGGCDVTETGISGLSAPTCGNSITVNYAVNDDCGQSSMCSASFSVATAPNLIASCPSNLAIRSCESQASIDAQFSAWLNNFTYTGGCNVTESGLNVSAPSACGGNVSVSYVVSDDCGQSSMCTADFIVANTPSLSIVCPSDVNIGSCESQSYVDAQFSTWINGFTYVGGCNVIESGLASTPPSACGGTVTINYVVMGDCDMTSSCSASFTVQNTSSVMTSCPSNMTLQNCVSQSTIDSQFATWLSQFSYTGGCNITEAGNTGSAPACGESVTINYSATDICGMSSMCSATFTVASSDDLMAICPGNINVSTCETQSNIDAQFATWLSQFTYTGGCNVTESGNSESAPLACGGSVTINYVVNDDCSNSSMCSATFSVATASTLMAMCPGDQTIYGCNTQEEIDAQFATWIAGFSYTGGCNVIESGNDATAPQACGGSVSIVYSVSDACGMSSICFAAFTVVDAPNLTAVCPNDMTLNNCQSQSFIDGQFETWLSGFFYFGGCFVTENGKDVSAPSSCGGSTTVNYTTVDACGQSSMCSATFTILAAPELQISCPNDMIITECLPQSEIDNLFASWQAGFTYTGGCQPVNTQFISSGDDPVCGESITVNYTIVDGCSPVLTCSAVFSVNYVETCQDTIYVSNNGPNTPNFSYESSNMISTSGDTEIQTNDIIFSAGQEVELNAGFDSGMHDFEVIIEGCNPE